MPKLCCLPGHSFLVTVFPISIFINLEVQNCFSFLHRQVSFQSLISTYIGIDLFFTKKGTINSFDWGKKILKAINKKVRAGPAEWRDG